MTELHKVSLLISLPEDEKGLPKETRKALITQIYNVLAKSLRKTKRDYRELKIEIESVVKL